MASCRDLGHTTKLIETPVKGLAMAFRDSGLAAVLRSEEREGRKQGVLRLYGFIKEARPEGLPDDVLEGLTGTFRLAPEQFVLRLGDPRLHEPHGIYYVHHTMRSRAQARVESGGRRA